MAMRPSEIVASLAILGCAVRLHPPDELVKWGLTQKELAALDEAIAIVESFDVIRDWSRGKCYACTHVNSNPREEPCMSCQPDPYRPGWEFRWPERKKEKSKK